MHERTKILLSVGSALALVGAMFDIEVKVYMVRVSYDQKPYRRHLMENWGRRSGRARARKPHPVGKSWLTIPIPRATLDSRFPKPPRTRRTMAKLPQVNA